MAEMIGPAWAYGCSECTFGLVLDAPIPHSSMSLYEIRRMQARDEIIAFCECRAGQAYKAFVNGKVGVVVDRLDVQPLPARQSAPRSYIHDMPPAVAEELLDIYA